MVTNAVTVLVEEAARAKDLQDLLNHIAWTETIKPKLLDLKTVLSEQLVNHDLGEPLPGRLSREQLAGRIQGISFVIKLIERILTQGGSALADLRSVGFSM